MSKGTPWEDHHAGWMKLGGEIFSFLVNDFHCSATGENRQGAYRLIFLNPKIKVAIFFAPQDPGVTVRLGTADEKQDFDLLKLVTALGGKVKYPAAGFAAHLNQNGAAEEVEVDYQKSLQCESLGYDEPRLRAVLTEYARLLLKYGGPILRGERLFPEKLE